MSLATVFWLQPCVNVSHKKDIVVIAFVIKCFSDYKIYETHQRNSRNAYEFQSFRFLYCGSNDIFVFIVIEMSSKTKYRIEKQAPEGGWGYLVTIGLTIPFVRIFILQKPEQ